MKNQKTNCITMVIIFIMSTILVFAFELIPGFKGNHEFPEAKHERSYPSYKTFTLEEAEAKRKWPFYLENSRFSNLRDIDLSKFSDLERNYLEQHLPTLIKRSERIADLCRQNKTVPEFHRSWNDFIWFTEAKIPLVYLPIRKIASTTMTINFLYSYFYNRYNSSDYLNEIEKNDFRLRTTTAASLFTMPRSLDKRVELFKKSNKVIVVRHPFSRILSPFKFKLMHNGSKISKAKRISKFKKYVDDILRPKSRDRMKHTGIGSIYLTQTEANEVCSVDPGIVMKLETLNEDIKTMAYVSDIAALKETVSFPKSVQHPTKYDKSIDFFGALNETTIQQLYNFYEEDFQMFNYTLDEFFNT